MGEFRGRNLPNTDRTMHTPLRTLLGTVATVAALVANATVYYVSSASGVDTNNGTSQSSPWKTIDRVNQSTYSVAAGDQILFQRGGVYRGEIIWGVSGTAPAPVVYGAYGTGADPIINGAKVITGWADTAATSTRPTWACKWTTCTWAERA